MWERLPFTGLGARGTADMAGKRPLCASGPMMSALNFSFADFALPQNSPSKLGSAFGLRKIRFLFFKKKEERKTHNPPKFRIFEA